MENFCLYLIIGLAFAGLACVNIARIRLAKISAENTKCKLPDYDSRRRRAYVLRYIGYGLTIVALILLLLISN
ncbi:MAG: hypothetical protein OSJ46_08205 [Duncaniella sp.]|nr:hypothetical protein [Duncaniella sp.]HBI58470.1 hypothetical protein [Porphyromonadaceae bacterium]